MQSLMACRACRSSAEAGGRAGEAPAITRQRFDAAILDMDGVVTDTAEAHAAAWKRLFDDFLEARAEAGSPFVPFDPQSDYLAYVDGKPRYDGVRDFLASRGISLPEGSPDDGPDRETVCGLGNRKNSHFQAWLAGRAARTYPDALGFVQDLQAAGIKVAVVSASRNCGAVLESAGLADLFDAKVDGVDMARLRLPGKPDPAIFQQAAQRLGVRPERALVVEDALAGVEAGARGGFALTIGLARDGVEGARATALREHGADVVLADLAGLVPRLEEAALHPMSDLPAFWHRLPEVRRAFRDRRPACFLDFDGTLTPIVEDPDKAFLSEGMRRSLAALAGTCSVGVVSGRDLADVRRRVGLDDLYYAGSHGFEIAGPEGLHRAMEKGVEYLPALDAAEDALRREMSGIAGAVVERKRFDIAVHYRHVAAEEEGDVEDAVAKVVFDATGLRKTRGKMVLQVQPDIEWDKGKAVLWLLQELDLRRPDVLPLFVGDDVTDEDAFRMLRGIDGLGIVVRDAGSRRLTAAHYALESVEEVQRFLDKLTETASAGGTW